MVIIGNLHIPEINARDIEHELKIFNHDLELDYIMSSASRRDLISYSIGMMYAIDYYIEKLVTKLNGKCAFLED
jgi:hypothetical protein